MLFALFIVEIVLSVKFLVEKNSFFMYYKEAKISCQVFVLILGANSLNNWVNATVEGKLAA